MENNKHTTKKLNFKDILILFTIMILKLIIDLI